MIIILTMNKVAKYFPWFFGLVALLMLCLHLEAVQRYLFFFREQQQLFVYDTFFFCDRYLTLGGLSLFVSQFLIQFFIIPKVGAIVTAVLSVLIACFIWLSLRKINDSTYLFPLCFLPVLFQIGALYDFYYFYHGLVAFCLMTICFYLYTVLLERLNWKLRILCSSVMTILVYLLLGPVGLLFAVGIFIFDIFRRNEKAYLQVIPIVIVLLMGFFLVVSGQAQSARLVFLNDGYYEPILEPILFFQYSWMAFIGLLLLFWLLHFLPKAKPLMSLILSLILFVGVTSLFSTAAKQNKQDLYNVVELQHYVAAEEWDNLLQSPAAWRSNYLSRNLFNLALSHKGKLLSNLFDLEQYSPISLIIQGDYTIPDLTIMMTHIYYQMGNVGASMNKAFNSFVGTRYGNPIMLKMLVKANLIYGTYDLADKYISLLEKTWAYSDWAKEQRRFLYNDEAVNSDPEYGAKRKGLPDKDYFVFNRGPYVDMLHLLESGSTDLGTRDYAIAFVILAKDPKNTKRFVEEYYGTEVMKEVPVVLQQALIAMSEDDLDYCRAHGVTEETIKAYEEYKRAYLNARNSGMNPAAALKRDFRKTYWYYYMFVGTQDN